MNSKRLLWLTSLASKAYIPVDIEAAVKRANVAESRILPMRQRKKATSPPGISEQTASGKTAGGKGGLVQASLDVPIEAVKTDGIEDKNSLKKIQQSTTMVKIN